MEGIAETYVVELGRRVEVQERGGGGDMDSQGVPKSGPGVTQGTWGDTGYMGCCGMNDRGTWGTVVGVTGYIMMGWPDMAYTPPLHIHRVHHDGVACMQGW